VWAQHPDPDDLDPDRALSGLGVGAKSRSGRFILGVDIPVDANHEATTRTPPHPLELATVCNG
jgi:hypothetical protein